MKYIQWPLIKRFVVYLVVIVLVISGLYHAWSLHDTRKRALDELREEAEIITAQFISMRQFIADNQDKINYDSEGNFEFKELNPAAVGQGVASIFGERTDYSIKQAAIDARNPENEADEFERTKISQLKENPEKEEIYEETNIDGDPYFRYLQGMRAEESCLDCHGSPEGETDIAGYTKEGYSEGDLIGALSIKVPMDNFYDNLRSTYFSLSVFTIILVTSLIVGIYCLMKKLVSNPLRELTYKVMRFGEGDFSSKQAYESDDELEGVGEIYFLNNEFNNMAQKLTELYTELEDKVQERTADLKKLNDKLQESNRMKSEFLANMSHELKTPLTSIIACSELLLVDDRGKLTEEEQENLQDINESANKLLTMISDILEFSKAEMGALKLNLEKVNVCELINESEREFRPWAKQKEISLTTDLPSNCEFLSCDPEKILQVLKNLVFNAIKFTSSGGNVTIGLAKRKTSIEIFVQDDGVGIAEHKQDEVFEKFAQLDQLDQRDQTNTQEHQGTGLGLSLVKELVELHGGEVKLDSTLHQGSTFIISLPIM